MPTTKLKQPSAKDRMAQLEATVQKQTEMISQLLNKEVSSAVKQQSQNTRVGRIVDNAIPSHTVPSKNPDYVGVICKGSKKNYQVWMKAKHLSKVKFGKEIPVKEYTKKDGDKPTSAVITLSAGVRGYVKLPE